MGDKIDEKPGNRPLSMKELWDDAEKRFRRDTGMDLRSKGKTSFDDCLDKIAQLQVIESADAPPSKPSGTERAKEFGLGILSFLKLLGGVAAEAADMTFPASGLVSNAVLFLLDIPGDLHEFHQAVDGLFETLGEGLSHFRIYDKIEQFTKIEDELIQTIHRLLISFVTICGLSINLRQSGKWKKFKGDAKRIIFRDDSGVKGEVDNFNALLEAHQRVQGTQTLKTVLETNDRVAKVLNKASETGQKIDHLLLVVVDMKDSADKRKADEERKENLAKIREKLELDDSDRATSALKASKDMCANLWRERLPGTVSWVDNAAEQPEFHQWLERKETGAKPLFVVTGDSNTGKSVIASSVVNRLKSIYDSPTRKLDKTFIASYFFPIISGKVDSDNQPIHTALRCLAFQLAEADHQYAATLVRACNTHQDIKSFLKTATCEDLWKFLGLGTPSGKTAYYFVIDGLGSLPDSFRLDRADLFTLLDNLGKSSRSVRALITLKSDRAQSTFEEASCWNLQTHDIGKPDISKFIDVSLGEDDILQGDDDYRTEKRTIIRDRLFNELNGNYFKVKTALEKIKAIVRKTGKWDDIVKVLDEANEDEKSISLRAIRELETTLEPEEIDELNELLIWTAYARGQPFSLKELEDALLLRFKVPSLLKLEKKIKGKYSKIFEISGGHNVLIREDILDLVRKERTGMRGEDDEAKFDVTITITKANLAKVQRFLWNLSMKLEATQDKFGFQQLEDKTKMHGSIQVNEFDSYMAILNRTFAVIAEEPNKAIESFTRYLLGFLPDHLEALSEAPTTQPLTLAEKQSIGDGLFSLFATGDVIEKHWESCDRPLIWNRDRAELDIFLSWFKDPEVTSKLGRMDRRWLSEVIASKDPHRALLINIMKMVANHLFCERDWDVLRPYTWIRDFLIWAPPPRDFEDPEGDSPSTPVDEGEEQARIDRLAKEHPDDEVRLVSAWCQEVLGVTERDDCWNQRLGEIYFSQDDFQNVVDVLEGTPDHENPQPRCLELLALSLARRSGDEGRLPDACRIMEQALKMLRDDETSDKIRMSKDYRHLSEWYRKLANLETTIDCLQQALLLSPGNHFARYDLLFAWLEKENNEEEALKLLQELVENTTEAEPRDRSQFGQVITTILSEWTMDEDQEARVDREFGRLFSTFSVRRPEFGRLTLQELDRAIERARKTTDWPESNWPGLLLFFRGLAVSRWHYNMEDVKKPAQTALDYWKEGLDPEREMFDPVWFRRIKNFQSAALYEEALEEWRRKGSDTPESGSQSQSQHIAALLDLIARERTDDPTPTKLYLASYHIITNQPSAAKEVMQDSMNQAFDMLSDRNMYNDLDAFGVLAYILTICRDRPNAQSAFSLLLPTVKGANVLSWILEFDEEAERSVASELIKKVEDGDTETLESLSRQLDMVLASLTEMEETTPEKKATFDKIRCAVVPYQERATHILDYKYICCNCLEPWDIDSRLNFCLCCHDMGFCDSCLKILRSETDRLKLKVPASRCKGHHETLVTPDWTKEGILEGLKGNVLAGGTVGEDGKRVGGEYVPITQWLGVLKSEWGYVERDWTDSEPEEEIIGVPGEEAQEDADKSEELPAKEIDETEKEVEVVEPVTKVDAVVSTALVEIAPSA